MSSGASQVTLLKKEVTPGVTPTTGDWIYARQTNNTVTPTVNTAESEEITEERISQGSIVTSVTIAGDLEGEFSFETFDDLFAAAFYNVWTTNVLTFGGKVRQTFSMIKGYTDVDVYAQFKGLHVASMTLNITTQDKISITFTFAGMDYEGSTVNPATITIPANNKPFMSNINVGTLTLDGESLEGIACVSGLTITIDNGLQEQWCLGKPGYGPGAQIATAAGWTGDVTLAWSQKAFAIWGRQFTRQPIALSFPITDSIGNRYVFDLPSIEINGDLPTGGKNDILQATLNYTVSKIAPTLTRIPAVAVTGVTVSPSTNSMDVGDTQQLAATAAPSGAPQGVQWVSSAPSVATVSSTGLVTAVAVGSATITATSTADGTKSGTASVTVS